MNQAEAFTLRNDLPRSAVKFHFMVGTEDDQPISPARLRKVQEQLRLYDHPLLRFEAREKGDSVEVLISLREMRPNIHVYVFELHPRDLDNPRFEWHFQRQLYDCLHDYLVEMFIRTPQDFKERRKLGTV